MIMKTNHYLEGQIGRGYSGVVLKCVPSGCASLETHWEGEPAAALLNVEDAEAVIVALQRFVDEEKGAIR